MNSKRVYLRVSAKINMMESLILQTNNMGNLKLLEKITKSVIIVIPCMRVIFPRWEDGDPMGWILKQRNFFRFIEQPEASKVEIASIQLDGDYAMV